jgi:hypothetical protein
MSGSAALEGFCANAREQQRRLEWLLACRRRLGVVADKQCTQRAKVRWTADIADPEFKKNLKIFHRLVAEAVRICSGDDHKALEARLDELTSLIDLPTDVPVTLDLLLVRRFELERLLVEVGDEKYLRGRAADFYSEGEGTVVTWERLVQQGRFPVGPPPLLAEDGGRHAADQTRWMLAWLLAAKETQDLPLRARRELKLRALLVVLPLIVVTTALFGLAIGTVDEAENGYLLAAAAGAAGAGLGGLLRLRDEVNLGAQIREFVPFFAGQLVVGAAAGLLVSVVVQAGIIRVGGGAGGLAALGFVVGFSEAAFLGLISRVGETASGAAKQKTE